MTQSELAERLGVSESYISQVMNGKKKPSKRMLGEMVNLCQPKAESNLSILSLARLPIPTLPRDVQFTHKRLVKSSPKKLTKVNQILTLELVDAFLASRRQGLSSYTLIFYHRCLARATGIELSAEGIIRSPTAEGLS